LRGFVENEAERKKVILQVAVNFDKLCGDDECTG